MMLRILLSSVALLVFASVEAQQYPSRPIRFVMAYPPGGSSDALARPIANEMTKGLGQPVLLEYKPGAARPSAPTSRRNRRPTATPSCCC